MPRPTLATAPAARPAAPGRLGPALIADATRLLRRRDPLLGRVIRRAGPCALRVHGDPYAGLVRAVVHQQLAGAAAAAIERRLHAAFGGRVPRAAALAAAPEETLAGVGLSRQKRATLREIARAFDAGVLSPARLRRLPDDAVIDAVTQLRGIGEWTAHMLLLFHLGRPDVLPIGDYGVRKGAMRTYGLAALPGRRELEALGERWRPYRSVATWYLWRAAEGEAPA